MNTYVDVQECLRVAGPLWLVISGRGSLKRQGAVESCLYMVNTDDVTKIARLSRLHLNEDELRKVQRKFADVLGFFQDLAACPTEGVQPLYHATEKTVLREDKAEPALSPEALLENAPEESNQCFSLPRVVAADE